MLRRTRKPKTAKIWHWLSVSKRVDGLLVGTWESGATAAAAGHWSDAALEARYVEGGMEAIRHLGAPDWLVRVVPTICSLSLSVRRRIRAVTRRSVEPSE